MSTHFLGLRRRRHLRQPPATAQTHLPIHTAQFGFIEEADERALGHNGFSKALVVLDDLATCASEKGVEHLAVDVFR